MQKKLDGEVSEEELRVNEEVNEEEARVNEEEAQ
jgi:hypothetical protein